MNNHILAVVGAQNGSEGKGVIVNSIASKYNTHIRVGAPNAGHTLYHNKEKFVMQTIPCGWTNPKATLILGRGILINPDILIREIEMLEKAGYSVRNRLKIDSRAGILSQRFHDEEDGVNGEMHQRIGSTGEGVGAARIARLRRDPDQFCFFEDVLGEYPELTPYTHGNTPKLIQDRLNGGNILLEGTQGSNLSLLHGPWPYVTSSDTNAAQMAADAGIPPSLITQTLLVARTFPIRVAGNSGPLTNEVSWRDISSKIGVRVEERTTVTKKIRRIGEWDHKLIENAILLNKPTSMAVTFLDYAFPLDVGVTKWEDLTFEAKAWVGNLQQNTDLTVRLIGTGGEFKEVIGAEDFNG